MSGRESISIMDITNADVLGRPFPVTNSRLDSLAIGVCAGKLLDEKPTETSAVGVEVAISATLK
ncbi:hypothetical protein C5Y93_05655 [Blastopirellula marina]|uniref:Uncharacterized protein n=1 Tax=Blastopirellula marina TaxID=124 RepID=A0A2S8GRF5_9BACT|nr:hypothetical protein C5Y93_05655 [Blastopirellula marina]